VDNITEIPKAIGTPNLASMFPWTIPTRPLKNFRGQGHLTPVNFSALNANSFNTVKVMDFIFSKHVHGHDTTF